MAFSFLDTSASLTGPGGVAMFGGVAGGTAEEGISVRPEGQRNTLTMGAGGTAMNSLRAAKNGLVTIRLLKTSSQNPVMGAMFDIQTLSSVLWGINVLVITHSSGEIITCRTVAFQNPPEMTYATLAGMNEWVLDCGYIDRVFGTYS